MDRFDSPSPAQVGAYAHLFVNRGDVVMTCGRSGSWICRRQSLSRSGLSCALAGSGWLGLYAVSEAGASRWICLDLDDDASADRLFQVVDLLDDRNCALLESSRRGFHLWVFIEPTSWEQARAWGQELARKVGLAEMEVFPKSGGLNGVRAPLTRHPKDGVIHPVIDAETGEIASDPWALLGSRRRARVPRLDRSKTSANLAYRTGRTGRTDHLALVAEIERHTRLRFYGVERAIGRCPFHDDRHPSFGVMGGYWKCFAGCGSGGLTAFRARARRG